jgi:hypothetical protein
MFRKAMPPGMEPVGNIDIEEIVDILILEL